MIGTKSFESLNIKGLDSQVNTFIKENKLYVTDITYNDVDCPTYNRTTKETDPKVIHYAHIQFREDKNQ